MSGFRYQLNLAGAVWTFDSPVEIKVEDNCMPFMTDAVSSDITISYQLGKPDHTGEEIVSDRNPIVWKGPGYHRVERRYILSLKPHSCYFMREDDPFHVDGLLYSGKEKFFESLSQLMGASDLEVHLANLGAISLHSSLIRYQGKAILFTAPSGTGKSTQADLWAKHRGADVFNGDRSMIRKIGGSWTAFGSPFAGTSGLYRNESAPIRAIIVLRKAETNSIRMLGQAEAFRCLYSETIIPRWNDKAHSLIMDLITQITAEIPVVMLSCRPEESSVDLLNQFLQEELNDR